MEMLRNGKVLVRFAFGYAQAQSWDWAVRDKWEDTEEAWQRFMSGECRAVSDICAVHWCVCDWPNNNMPGNEFLDFYINRPNKGE